MGRTKGHLTGPYTTETYRGKSIGGYTLIGPTAERSDVGSYLWAVRCDTCHADQVGLVTPAKLKAFDRNKTRRLCENPACSRHRRRGWFDPDRRKAAVAAVAAAGGCGADLAATLGVSKQRAKQILDEAMTTETADAKLAAATLEQLLAAVMRRPAAQRRLIAIAMTTAGDDQ
jgi:hypothetical protein